MNSRIGEWCRELQALAQNGLAYSTDKYDIERFRRLQEITTELLSRHSDGSLAEAGSVIHLEAGYLTPKVDVRAGAFQDGKLLMVREASDGLWSLPGGWADVNESPSEAVIREVQEESGLTVSNRKIVSVFDRDRHGHPPMHYHVYKMFFLCEVVGGTPTPSAESTEVHFFDLADTPPDLSTARVTMAQIEMLFRHHGNPNLPTEFD